MSTSGRIPGRILIAASCLRAWDRHVGNAVMTYYPTMDKKVYFDGTIQLPEQVRCEAFNIRSGKIKPPCRSCGNLFGLTTDQTDEWPYGNCAEAESLSNLLKNDTEVREQTVQSNPRLGTAANRDRARQEVLNELERYLENVNIRLEVIKFYLP